MCLKNAYVYFYVFMHKQCKPRKALFNKETIMLCVCRDDNASTTALFMQKPEVYTLVNAQI